MDHSGHMAIHIMHFSLKISIFVPMLTFSVDMLYRKYDTMYCFPKMPYVVWSERNKGFLYMYSTCHLINRIKSVFNSS